MTLSIFSCAYWPSVWFPWAHFCFKPLSLWSLLWQPQEMNTERSRGFWCTLKLKAPWLRAVFLQVRRDRGLSLVLPNKIKPKSDVFIFLKQVSMVTFMHTKIWECLALKSVTLWVNTSCLFLPAWPSQSNKTHPSLASFLHMQENFCFFNFYFILEYSWLTMLS